MNHSNPIKKIMATPIIKRSGIGSQQNTPQRKRSYSIKNPNQLPNTRSPQDTATNFK